MEQSNAPAKTSRVRQPNRRQLLAAQLSIAHPDWTAKLVLQTAGYKGKTIVQPGRLMARPSFKLAAESVCGGYQRSLISLYSPEVAAQKLAELAESDNPMVRLRAIDRIVEYLGLVEPTRSRRRRW